MSVMNRSVCHSSKFRLFMHLLYHAREIICTECREAYENLEIAFKHYVGVHTEEYDHTHSPVQLPSQDHRDYAQ